MIHRALPLAVLLALFPASRDERAQEPDPSVNFQDGSRDYSGPYAQHIFFAVLEGLYADGVSTGVVEKIVALDEHTHWPANFVYACPVCTPAYDAFRVYRSRPKFYGRKGDCDTYGPGLPEDTIRRLTSEDVPVRQAAIQELVQGWIARRMEALRLSEKEREDWRAEMDKRRRQGMSLLELYRSEGLGGTYATMKACPLCEAASGACRAR